MSQYLNEVFDIKNEEDFKTKVLESKKPVISPILTDIVDGRYGNMDLTEVNIDNNEFQTQ